MQLVERIHEKHIFSRRVRVLAQRIAALIPDAASVLDVGCGDGQITSLISRRRPDIQAEGIDVLVRDQTLIPVTEFDGYKIPFPDQSFDIVLFIDVLHHTENPAILLAEAARVARKGVILKDHLCDGFLARPTLRFMDRVGNERHGVVLPFNYWTKAQWLTAFQRLGLQIEVWQPKIGLYPWFIGLFFERSLHFIAHLKRTN